MKISQFNSRSERERESNLNFASSLIFKKSFTLIELSIVLLILSLLVGSLLVGRQIVDRARNMQNFVKSAITPKSLLLVKKLLDRLIIMALCNHPFVI